MGSDRREARQKGKICPSFDKTHFEYGLVACYYCL